MRDEGVMPAWSGHAMLLVDLDAFFASVEQLDHPGWRGRPVIVGGDPQRRGVVSTASYEARRFGVHSAMPSITARELCPDAIWTRGRFDRYREMSRAVMRILLDESPLLEQVSIDEAFLDVTQGRYTGDHPLIVAERIRSRVAELGITCSIGLATTKTVAKIASDMDKPNGITVVYPGTEGQFLSPLPVTRLSGIGRATAAKLGLIGVTTLGQVAVMDDATAHEVFGSKADSVRMRCRGTYPEPIRLDREVKSVSNEMTFERDLTVRDEVEGTVISLSEHVGRRLRRKGLAGNVVTLKMRYRDLSVRTARRTLDMRVDDEAGFIPVAIALIDELWTDGVPVRLVGVGVSGFDHDDMGEDAQLGLFDGETVADEVSSGRRERLVHASDKVRERFGDGMLSSGRALGFKERGTGTGSQNLDDPGS